MSHDRHIIPVTFTFSGHVEIHALLDQVRQIATDSFGLVLGSGLHDSDDRIIDWDFSLHPDKTVGTPQLLP